MRCKFCDSDVETIKVVPRYQSQWTWRGTRIQTWEEITVKCVKCKKEYLSSEDNYGEKDGSFRSMSQPDG